MTKGEALAKIMDDATRRVRSGEPSYDVANGAVADLAHLEQGEESAASGSALVYWMDISDLLDAPGGPQSEDLCDLLTAEFTSRWAALASRREETVQATFMDSFSKVFSRHLAEYRSNL